MYRYIVISITAIVVLLLGATAISAASQSALPGDSLYSVKTGLEDAQMSSAADVETKAELNIHFAQKRLEEIKVLAEQGRLDKIEVAVTDLEVHVADATEQVQQLSAQNVDAGAALSLKLAALIADKEQVMRSLALSPTVSDSTSVGDNGNDNDTIDNNSNDDNANDSNANDNNANDDNGNTDEDNGNDDNSNANEDNDNEDNGNANNEDNANDNGNTNEDNGNDDNGNPNDNNDNDDNGNTNDGNDDNSNANDANDNDDNGNTNVDNSNANEDNGNEDNGNDNDDDDDDD